MGNKTKLLPFIKDTIEQECGDFNSIFDAFAGTGAVASAFLDKKIIVNDILYCNYISYIAWFENSEYDDSKILNMINSYNNIDKNIPDNYMSDNFSDTYFSRNVCRKIGYIREDIETQFNIGNINKKEKAILITSLLYAMDKIANTCGHYDAWRKNADFVDEIILQPLEVFSGTNKTNQFFNVDINKLAPDIKCDVVYLDPPYNSRQYCDAYHLLENVARWEKPEVKGVAKKMNRDNLKSEYCKVLASAAFEKLINSLNCKFIVLSYNNTGDTADSRSNAKIADEDIFRILNKKGEVKVFSKKYKSFSTGKSKILDNEERLFICKVKSEKETICSPLNYTGGKSKLLPQILPLFPENISTFYDLFCGGCNVGINVKAEQYVYNDINSVLINLFKVFKKYSYEQIISRIKIIIKNYNLSDSSEKGYEFYNCSSSEGLSSVNKLPYLNLRNDFNNQIIKDDNYYFMFYTLIVFAFNNQIRFNSLGNYNLPVGKRDFNFKMQSKIKSFCETLKNQKCEFFSRDFRDISMEQINKNDFVYIDPPYLVSNASYNECDGWNEKNERELLCFIDELDRKGIPFALSNVLSNKGNENIILKKWLDKNNRYKVHHLNFSYKNSNYHRKKNGETDEVLITNY